LSNFETYKPMTKIQTLQAPNTSTKAPAKPRHGAAPGERRGGRAKGTPNKLTQNVRQALEYVAEGLGGAEGMLQWARDESENKRLFWSQMYLKLLPKETKMELSGIDGAPLAPPVLVAPETLTMAEFAQAATGSKPDANASTAS
jgi:hypothetical protein